MLNNAYAYQYNEDEKIKRKTFYYVYRFKQRLEGCIWGLLEGVLCGFCIGGKWGGAGGWLMGGLTQLLGLFAVPCIFIPMGGILGALSDKRIVSATMKTFRYTVGSGGTPPNHGMVS